jgi:hypothetical protein
MTDRGILEALAHRHNEFPRWARDLLMPYVRPVAMRVCTVNEESNPNECAMSPTREEPMKLGTTVIFGKRSSNGTDEHPAIVTRVWGDGETPTVNLTVWPDCGDSFFASSVQYWKSQEWGSGYYYREQ